MDNFELWLEAIREAAPVPDGLLGGGESPGVLHKLEDTARLFYSEEQESARHDALTGGRGPKSMRHYIISEHLDDATEESLSHLVKESVIPRLKM